MINCLSLWVGAASIAVVAMVVMVHLARPVASARAAGDPGEEVFSFTFG
ncbi:MAG TPA: hypothetical protein VHL99_04170 [Candidatus Binatia bacterium]|jgi:hypothetical protein|nr:hypothetical protein [Candidatus Binatia bacterium]